MNVLHTSLVLLSLTLFTTGLAQAPTLPASFGSSPVSDAVENIRQGVESTINTGAARINGTIILGQGAATALLNQLDLIADNRQGKLVRDLSQQEQRVFADAYSLLRGGQEWTSNTVQQINSLTRDASNILSLIPGMKQTPILQEVSPTFFARTNEATEVVEINFKGLNLGLSTPIMKLSNRDCRPKNVTNNEAKFECPVSGKIEKPIVLAGEVSFFKVKTAWDTIKGWIFKTPPKLQNYVTSITLLPSAMGTVDAVMISPSTQTESMILKDTRSDQNEHCAGERRTDFIFVTPREWRLDPNMQPKVVADTREDSTYIGLTGRTDTQFTLSGTVKNVGQCVKVSIPFVGTKIISYDARGKVGVAVEYTVIRDVVKDAETALPGQPLRWGKDLTIKFPPEATQMRVTINQINGISKTTSNSEKIGWVEVVMDKSANTAIIRPLTPDQALRQ